MIDVIIVGELFWIWLWVRTKSAERALLCVGAMFTSVFVAAHISPWFTRRFMESGNTFMWLADKMQAATHPVGIIGLMVPAVPASTGIYDKSQWIALHVLQGLFTVLITWAVFMLFIIIEYLMQAFWDDTGDVLTRGDGVVASIAGIACGLVVVWTTIWLLANLSWISALKTITTSMDHSALLHFAAYLLHAMLQLKAVLS